MEIVEKGFKINDDFVEDDFAIDKEEFGKQRSPLWQFSKFKYSERTEDSSIIERALLQFLNDIFAKSERKHLKMQRPPSQFSNEQSSIVTLRQRSQ
jgi:hypothetical protein